MSVRAVRVARALVGLTLVVVLAHLLGLDWLARHVPSGETASDAPARIEVAFVRELAPTTPPPVAPVRPAAVLPARTASSMTTVVVDAPTAGRPGDAQAEPPRVATAPSPAPPPAQAAQPMAEPEPDTRSPSVPAPASQTQAAVEPSPQSRPLTSAAGPKPAGAPDKGLPEPAPEASVPVSPLPPPTDLVPAPAPATASAPPSVAPAPSVPPATASPPPAFEWPPSTRLSYTLVGDYRGPVHGSASVEWLRSGPRYQVHLDVRVGPEMAPLMSRRMSSDGEITPQGLRPRRYDEVTRVLFSTRRRAVLFEPDGVVLAGGGRAALPPGVQDSASQFVQMTWWFNLQPQRLRAGETLAMPLALPQRVSLWHYDVMGEERLALPFGAVSAWYLKPRPDSPGKSDLSVEVWVAPSLQYLPVRLRIRQEPEATVDLTLSRPPQQAAEPAATVAAPPPRSGGAP